MAQDSLQLDLTDTEVNVLKLLQYAEGLLDVTPRRLGGTLGMPDEAVFALRKAGFARPYRIVRDPVSKQNQVRFTLPELYRYVTYACRRLGLRINLDGSITTCRGQNLTLDEVH